MPTDSHTEPMVKQEFDPRFDGQPELKRLVKMAARILADVTEDTYSPAVAKWSLRPDPDPETGQRMDPVGLHLFDPELSVWAQGSFSKGGLQDRGLTGEILRLWGKLLERRSATRIDRLMKALREEGNELQ